MQLDVKVCDRQGAGCRDRGAQAPQLVDDALVGDLVASLVGGDGAADLAQHRVAVLDRVAGGRAVAHLGGALLRQARARVQGPGNTQITPS